jgi:hypothetical protein
MQHNCYYAQPANYMTTKKSKKIINFYTPFKDLKSVNILEFHNLINLKSQRILLSKGYSIFNC